MDWVKALDNFFKVKGIYDKAKEVQKLHDYGKKAASKKKLEPSDLKYFKNKQMEEALKLAKQAISAADSALGANAIWPHNKETTKRFQAIVAARTKYGAESKQANAALAAYVTSLKEYDIYLKKTVSSLEANQKGLVDKLKTANALQKYGLVLRDAFSKLVYLPSFAGTAQNATFFQLSEDAQKYAGLMGSLITRLEKLEKKNKSVIAEGKELIDDNQLWLKFYQTPKNVTDDSFKKNEKAKKPKK